MLQPPISEKKPDDDPTRIYPSEYSNFYLSKLLAANGRQINDTQKIIDVNFILDIFQTFESARGQVSWKSNKKSVHIYIYFI